MSHLAVFPQEARGIVSLLLLGVLPGPMVPPLAVGLLWGLPWRLRVSACPREVGVKCPKCPPQVCELAAPTSSVRLLSVVRMVRAIRMVRVIRRVRVLRLWLVRMMRMGKMMRAMKMVRTTRMVMLGLMRRSRCLSPLQVFRVEVLCNGRRHTVTKRYSEFQALHKRIKKTCKVPDFPPRHVPNWMPKALEQRRQGLEVYLRGVLYHNEELPQDVLDFLKVRRCQQNPKASSPPTRLLPSQRPVVGFRSDPYVRPHGSDLLPNAVLSGVLQGLYLPLSSAPGQAAPPASGMRSSQTPTQHPGMQW
ncbi:sorting nexin-22 isoform X2 [Prinia subflava]|uniref:sorting nexin-22 isoform X2 n=1 Tax=Prinia subflava TaxID=208062 RepID=UPI002FE3AA47